MTVFLGVDGGGTKTALCLVSAGGERLADLEAPSCYYLGHGSTAGVELVSQVLGDAVPAVCARADLNPSDVAFAFLGLPAYGEVRGDLPALDAAPGAVLGHGRYRCDNDMVCGWAGSLGLADGINVVSGTGSITYGRRGDEGVRVGGWGELFGDEGSGYWIGIRGLRAFSRMSDGRLPAGPLLDVLREQVGLEVDLDLVDVVLGRWRGSRREVAALSRSVVDAARRGDGVAAGILEDAAGELALLAHTTRRRLGFDAGETVPVSCSGGVFSTAEVLDGFGRRLGALGRYAVTAPRYPPVVGAALYAARLAGQPLGSPALARLAAGGPVGQRDG